MTPERKMLIEKCTLLIRAAPEGANTSWMFDELARAVADYLGKEDGRKIRDQLYRSLGK